MQIRTKNHQKFPTGYLTLKDKHNAKMFTMMRREPQKLAICVNKWNHITHYFTSNPPSSKRKTTINNCTNAKNACTKKTKNLEWSLKAPKPPTKKCNYNLKTTQTTSTKPNSINLISIKYKYCIHINKLM